MTDMQINLEKLTGTELKALDQNLREERKRRQTKRVSHDMCGHAKCLHILGELTVVPQTAEELAACVTESHSIPCTDTEVRWVMRRYGIHKTSDTPMKFYLSNDKVKPKRIS